MPAPDGFMPDLPPYVETEIGVYEWQSLATGRSFVASLGRYGDTWVIREKEADGWSVGWDCAYRPIEELIAWIEDGEWEEVWSASEQMLDAAE